MNLVSFPSPPLALSLFRRYRTLYALFIATLFFMLKADTCNESISMVCFEISASDCPNVANARMKIKCYKGVLEEIVPGVIVTNLYPYASFDNYAIPRSERRVWGDHVNYGFWSKNAYRTYTYGEMFEWKYGRKPNPAEEAAITDAQAEQWFKERERNNTGFPLYITDDPVNVGHGIVNSGKACFGFAHPLNFPYEFEGTISFPNNSECKLDFTGWGKDLDPNNNPKTFRPKIVQPCAGCTL